MNSGVALVRAYLHLNGYFTVSELPIIALGEDGQYHEVTDVDMLAVRFPRAASIVSRGRPGLEDDLTFANDPDLDVSADRMDVIIGEVKEGKPRVNPALRSTEPLYTALVRTGCCPKEELDRVVTDVQRSGEAFISEEKAGIPCRVRLVAFGDGPSGTAKTYTVVPMQRIALFLRRHLKRHRKVLTPVRLSDPALGLLHLLDKILDEE